MLPKNADTHYLSIIDKFFRISDRNLWIYGAGVQGRELLRQTRLMPELRVCGFIDREAARMPHLDGLDVHHPDDYLGMHRPDNFVLIASRHWQEIRAICQQAGLQEASDFICLGRFCECNTPLEFMSFMRDFYYDPFTVVRETGQFEVLSDCEQGGLYDYMSNRKGDFTLNEGLYLERTVAENRLQRALELGASRGKSTLFLAKALLETGGEGLTTVDTWAWDNNDLEELFRHDFAGDFFHEFAANVAFNEAFQKMVRPVRKKVQAFLQETRQTFDFAFIDLFHSYEETREVFRLLKGKLEAGAHIIFHDYSNGWPGEVRAIDELIAQNKVRVIERACPGSLIHLEYVQH